jgi:hypothetical protein
MLIILVEKRDAILVILHFLMMAIFSLSTASLSCFLDRCMEKGMIFRSYYNWITYWLWLSKNSVKNKYQWLFKVLGGCVYCFGTWVFIVLYLVIVLYLAVLSDFRSIVTSVIGLFLGIGMNYFWIEVIQRIKR